MVSVWKVSPEVVPGHNSVSLSSRYYEDLISFTDTDDHCFYGTFTPGMVIGR